MCCEKFIFKGTQKPEIMKVLKCRDAGFDCDAVLRATSEGEVMERAVRHAQDTHGATLSPESMYEIRSMIKEED
jgi:predicted small metal-binding protein